METNYKYFNCIKFRKDKLGYWVSVKKFNENRRSLYLHRVIYEFHKGEIPDNYQIHHIDFNKNNNNIDNLIAVSCEEHLKIHNKTNWATAKVKISKRENLIKNALPKAIEWSKSEAGKEAARKRSIKHWEVKKTKEYICSQCGDIYTSLKDYSEKSNTFCSNKCKSKFRRKMGYDNVVKNCIYCGSAFSSNKYDKSTLCSQSCINKYRASIYDVL